MNRILASLALLLAQPAHGKDVAVSDVLVPRHESSVPVRCYASVGNEPRPLIVLLHGASGFSRFAAAYESHASSLVAQGYRVCAVFYYSGEDAQMMSDQDRAIREAQYTRRFDTWISEASDAIDYLSTSGVTKTTHVGLLGFSQGGFLAVAVAGANPRVQALVEFYGGVPTIVKHPITRLPPTFILHGEADEHVPVEEAYALETFVQTRAPSYAMKLYPGAPHGFDFELGGANSIDAKQRIVAFFAAHLRAPPK